MKLWLLRHGEAEPCARTDAERALTERGRVEARQSGARLAGYAPQAILTSPYVRARQTADLVSEQLQNAVPCETVAWIVPDADLREALLQLDRRTEQALLLVSHQPFIGELGGFLVHGHRGDPLPMRTGTLVELEGEAIAAGLMHVVGLHHPHIE